MGRDDKFMRPSYLKAKKSNIKPLHLKAKKSNIKPLHLMEKLFGHRKDCEKQKIQTYIDDDIFDALIAYMDAKKFRVARGPITNYALKKFLAEEGFYPTKPQQ